MNGPVTARTTASSRTIPSVTARGRARRRSAWCLAVVPALAGGLLGGLASPAWATATTYVANQASSSGWPVGSPIYDTVTLGYGANPTGTITFRLYHPTDTTCVGAPVVTSNTTVSGNGYYESARHLPTMAAIYRWTATYNGDANNSSSRTLCGDPGALVEVAKRRANLSGSAAASAGGTTSTDTVALSGASPTGTMQYKVYGPNDMTCATSPVHLSSRQVVGNGSYTSQQFTPAVTGTYRWTVMYGGDANNLAASSTCTDPSHAVDLAVLVAGGVSLVATPAAAAPGADLTVTWSGIASPTTTDWVGLFASGAPDSDVMAWKYTPGTAGATVTIRIPTGTFDGTYELRLFAQNSYTRLATSGPITVT